MDKQERLKAKVLAETLRLMATKIENGFPVTEEQEEQHYQHMIWNLKNKKVKISGKNPENKEYLLYGAGKTSVNNVK